MAKHPPMAWRLAAATVFAAAIAGCSSTKLDEAPVESRTPVPAAGAASGPGAGTAQSSVAMNGSGTLRTSNRYTLRRCDCGSSGSYSSYL